jgi:hypothetical protein
MRVVCWRLWGKGALVKTLTLLGSAVLDEPFWEEINGKAGPLDQNDTLSLALGSGRVKRTHEAPWCHYAGCIALVRPLSRQAY